jgi:trimethylamine--corrinoid protein Co-methyltransferase
MSRGKLEFLASDEIRRIHDTSIRVLEEVGVVLNSPSVRTMLTENGCVSSKDGKRVLVPEEVITSALAKVPRSILLASRDKKHDMRIPSDKLHCTNGGEGVFVKDLTTGEKHVPSSEDVRNFFRLSGSLPQTDFCWPMVGAQDAPAHLKGFTEMRIGFESTYKHIQSASSTAEEARNIIRLSSILTGGAEQLAKRPIWSAVQCPISPLTFEEGLAEAQVVLSQAGIPIVSMAAAVAGMTSPATISGTIAQVNAENLASLVISQVAAKGAPWIYSSDSCPGDLRTGSIDYGALEANLMRAGAGQMGRFYGLPTMVAGVALEGAALSLGKVADGVPIMMVQALVPSDLASGFGGIDQAAGASYEQLLVDAWVWDVAKEAIREFSADEAAISFETIRDGGLDGNFLGKRHTLARFKQEFISITKPEAASILKSDPQPAGTLVKKARKEVLEMLSGEIGPVVTADEASQIERLVKDIH